MAARATPVRAAHVRERSHREDTARKILATAAVLDADHPETIAGDHLRDAAKVLRFGSTEGAKRHLHAAMELLTPHNLIRHGITDDDGHVSAKHHMHAVHRHHLAVEDLEDLRERNVAASTPPEQLAEEPIAATGDHENRVTDLAGPYRFRHGWVRIEDAGHLDGAVVTARTARGHEVQGVFRHAGGTVHARHSSPVRVTHVQRPGAAPANQPSGGLQNPRKGRRLLAQLRTAGSLAGDQDGLELSARTAMLERTPAPRGRPGGPGLYGVKGMGHTPYLQQIVKALIEKRGMPPDKAYRIARGAIRNWMRGGKHAHPEVVAAAGRAEAGEIARQARAKASHHAIDAWEVAGALIELAADPIELFNPYHAPPGSPAGGTFTTAQGAGAQQAKGKAAKRAQLTRKIAALRHQIAGLEKQYRALTGRSHPKKITAAARKAGKAQTPQQAAAAAKASAKAKKTTTAPRRKGPSAATIHLKILALRAEMKGDIAQLRALK